MFRSVLIAFFVAVIAAAAAAPHDADYKHKWDNFKAKMEICSNEANFTREQIKEGMKGDKNERICKIPEGRKWMHCWFGQWGLIKDGLLVEEVFMRKVEDTEEDGEKMRKCLEFGNKVNGDQACPFMECIRGSDIKYKKRRDHQRHEKPEKYENYEKYE